MILLTISFELRMTLQEDLRASRKEGGPCTELTLYTVYCFKVALGQEGEIPSGFGNCTIIVFHH